MFVAAMLIALGVALLLIEPRPAILRAEERELHERLSQLTERIPGVSMYRRHRRRLLEQSMREDYRGALLHDVALFLWTGMPLEQALQAAARSAPEHHPWKEAVNKAQLRVRPGRSLLQTLREEVAGEDAALDLAVLRVLSESLDERELAEVADRLGDNADAVADARAREQAHRLPVRLSVLMVLCFLPAAILVAVGDIAWEAFRVFGEVVH